MKKLYQDMKKGEIRVKAESLSDLWQLSQIIDEGDVVSGRTLRKIKIGDEGDRNQKVVRKPMFLSLETEKSEFSNDVLRITGKVREGPDDVPLGSYHTFNIEEGSEATIRKSQWLKYQIDRIDESVNQKEENILLITMDREECYFASLERNGYKNIGSLKGDVQKKDVEQKGKGDFFQDIIGAILEYDKKYRFTKIVIGSPSFWKEDLLKKMGRELSSRAILATCSDVSEKSFDELIKRDEVQKALKDERMAREVRAVESLLLEISKDGNSSYGLVETEKSSGAGAVDTLIVADSFIWQMREKGEYKRLEGIMRSAENGRGIVLIVSSAHEAGQKLMGIGGIGAILRYKN